MRLIRLKIECVIVTRRVERRPNVRTARKSRISEEIAVYAILLKVFVQSEVVLFRVIRARRREASLIEYRRRARNIVVSRTEVSSPCETRCLVARRQCIRPELRRCRLHTDGRGIARGILHHQRSLARVRLYRLCEGNKRRVLICLEGAARGGYRVIRLVI